MSASVAEQLAAAVTRSRARPVPEALRATLESLLIDIGGLCVAARHSEYVKAAVQTLAAGGEATAIGHAHAMDPSGAALVNGMAAHGEDYDDTFEGGPVHAGAVIVPALLAAAERHRIAGPDLLRGIAVGVEVTCRASLVAPRRIHKAGFHPTSVLGAMGAAAGVATALRASEAQFVHAQGIAGSMAGGIIEYLAEGAWTKRMHPGWAAQSGLMAADLARGGFVGPRTVWEGTHGLLHGFAQTTDGDWEKLTGDFGERWVAQAIAFKPYACGTMIHPYIDCARRLARHGVAAEAVRDIVCEVGAGTVHRLWEPLEAKRRPPNAYAAKFSQPWCIAFALVHGPVGLDAFTDDRVRDERVAAFASKVRYEIDPGNPYPDEYTGHVRIELTDGRVLEERQPHLRGGGREPLTRREIEEKFRANCAHGGWSDALADRWLAFAGQAFDGPIDLAPFRG